MSEPVSPERVAELQKQVAFWERHNKILHEQLDKSIAEVKRLQDSEGCTCDIGEGKHGLDCPIARFIQERDEQEALKDLAEAFAEEQYKRAEAVEAHAQLVKGNIVGCFKRIWKNNEETARHYGRIGPNDQKTQAEARARAFKEAMFAVEKIDFVKAAPD